MTDPRLPGEVGNDDDEDDLGAPIDTLAALEYQPAPGFLRKVRLTIQRRILGRQMADFAWSAPRLVFLAFLDLMYGIVGRDAAEKGDTERWNR